MPSEINCSVPVQQIYDASQEPFLDEISDEALQMIYGQIGNASEYKAAKENHLKLGLKAIEVSKYKLLKFLNILMYHLGKDNSLFLEKIQYDNLVKKLKDLRKELRSTSLIGLTKLKTTGKVVKKAVADALEEMGKTGQHTLFDASYKPIYFEAIRAIKAELHLLKNFLKRSQKTHPGF